MDYLPKSSKSRITLCPICRRIYEKEYYRKNIEKMRKSRYDRNLLVSNNNRDNIYKYLKTHPCVDCGEKDPIVLEFDHIDMFTKVANISTLSTGSYSWNTILIEIEKCEVRCANCHRRKTATQFNYYRVKAGEA